MVKVEDLPCLKQLHVNKLTVSTQLSDVTFLMWQHVSPSKGHIQTSGIKLPKRNRIPLYTIVLYTFYTFEDDPLGSKHVATLNIY